MSRDWRFGRWHPCFRGGGWGLLYRRSGGGSFDAWSGNLGQSKFRSTSTDNLEAQRNGYAIKGAKTSRGSNGCKEPLA